jgi:hypothetical protein
MSKIFIFVLLTLCFSSIYGQETIEISEKPIIGLNSELTYQMMEPNQNLRKLEILIDAKSNNEIPNKSLSFGFSMIGIVDYQQSNRDSKFAYLMRHPTSNNAIGKTASEAVLHSAQVSFVGSINSWLTTYGELLYSPEQSFGSGTITSLGRNQVEFRKGIILLGNLNEFPLYLGLGKMDIPFGQTRSVSPFTNSSMWHAFGALGYSAVVGFKKYGINASFSAIQGGAQFRAANVPVDSTSVPSRINNFAADINYTYDFTENISLRVGASYLKGSGYCQPWPIAHFMPCSDYNPAIAFYGELTINDRILLKGSFAQTQEVWPGTYNPNPPLDVFEASKVSSLDFGAKYQINKTGKVLYSVSGEFSNFKAGPENSPWERQSQIVLGVNAQVEKTSRIFLELFRTAGYEPLNFISGGNFDDLGETHSDKDARSIGVVAGILFSI